MFTQVERQGVIITGVLSYLCSSLFLPLDVYEDHYLLWYMLYFSEKFSPSLLPLDVVMIYDQGKKEQQKRPGFFLLLLRVALTSPVLSLMTPPIHTLQNLYPISPSSDLDIFSNPWAWMNNSVTLCFCVLLHFISIISFFWTLYLIFFK